MIFWDASVLVSQCVEEPKTKIVRPVSQRDEAVVA